jgi:hypothetical protein
VAAVRHATERSFDQIGSAASALIGDSRAARPARRASRPIVGVLTALLALPALAGARVFVVNSSGDAGDLNPGDGVCHTGGVNSEGALEGTLRAAVEEANAWAGTDSIRFDIPPSDPGYGATPLHWTLRPTRAMPDIDGPVMLDATTQPGFASAPIIELDGTLAGVVSGRICDGIRITGGGSAIRGFVINRFDGDGIGISAAGSNIVEGNFIGTDVTGTAAAGNGQNGVRIASSTGNRIGGTDPASRNVISGNIEHGILLTGGTTTGNTIRGNYIGVDVSGSAAVGNGLSGVCLSDASSNIVGGSVSGASNVIGGNACGIRLVNGADGNLIRGNHIGTDEGGGLSLGNGEAGVTLESGSFDNQIGGTDAGAGNLIAYTVSGPGVRLGPTGGGGNAIIGNSIRANAGLGIDLEGGAEDGFGVTSNDPADPDAGPNGLQNYPTLDDALTTGSTITLNGSLDSTPLDEFRVEFFTSEVADASAHGEGETSIGFADLETDGVGGVSFTKSLPAPVAPGQFVTCTATGSDGSTSEFGACLSATYVGSIVGTVYHDINANSAFDSGELGIGTGWVKLISGGVTIQVTPADPDTGTYRFFQAFDGHYTIILDDNDHPADTTPTAPVNWLFQNPATGSLSVIIAGSEVRDADFGLVFDFDIALDCACGADDGIPTQRTIVVDGDMSDWGAPLSDPDNNACDPADDTDRDHPVQSTGRNLVRNAFTSDADCFSMLTQRIGSSSNTQTFLYYCDTDNDGLLQDGEPVVVARWQGNTGQVDMGLYAYDGLGTGPHALIDADGYADGYSMPGDLIFVKSLPAGSGQGSTSGDTDGIQMEWSVPWLDLGVARSAAISWHTSATNANPWNPGLCSKIDDNMGGCGGSCAGSNQFGGVDPGASSVTPGHFTYLFHRIGNTGNGDDAFDIESTDTGDFNVVSYGYYRDLGVTGLYEPGIDPPLTDTTGSGARDTGTIAAGDTIHTIVMVELPPPPASGTVHVTTTATSNYDPGCGFTITPPSRSIVNVLVIAYPELLVLKSTDTLCDPVNGPVNPKAIPRATIRYMVQTINEGEASPDTSTVMIADAIPIHAAMFVGDIEGPASGPIVFQDGAVSSGLSYTFMGLGSTVDDVDFSDDGGSTFSYVPVPDSDGFDPRVTHVLVNPKGELRASDGLSHPSFSVLFCVRVE